MKKEQPILSLCIPTYGRAEILRGNLEQIQKQLDSINIDEFELIVSNNCSLDHTEDVVQSFIKQGMPICYNCNTENLGSDGNFLKCMHMAKGKYILLLGDDDYLTEGSIAHILDCLRGKDYGLLYIDFQSTIKGDIVEYIDHNQMVRKIGRQFTYMSANVFRKDIVDTIDADKYRNTCLLQMPFFMTSCLSCPVNAVLPQNILIRDVGETAPPQKYDFIEVFSQNFITISSQILNSYSFIKQSTISYLKKDMMKYIRSQVFHNLVESPSMWKDERWKYVWPYYKKEWYFYGYMLLSFAGKFKRRLKSIL